MELVGIDGGRPNISNACSSCLLGVVKGISENFKHIKVKEKTRDTIDENDREIKCIK